MACGGCRKGSGTRHGSTGGDLSKFAYLTTHQLRLLKQQQEAEKAKQAAEENKE